MVKYWSVAPYRNQRTMPGPQSWHPEGFEQAWKYDRENSVIAIGWYEVGDLSGVSKTEIKRRYIKRRFNDMKNGGDRSRGYLNLQRFWHDIKQNDRIIARYGLKRIVGVGVVTGKPFYDLAKGQLWTGELPIRPHPNFLPVFWEEFDHEFKERVFHMDTVSEVKETHKHWPTLENVLNHVWDCP